jgi:hypothetical protein
VSDESQYGDEERIAFGGAQLPRAGCLLIPFFPIRAAGLLIVSTKRVLFDPILHYKLVTRRLTIDIDQIKEAEVAGANMEFSLMNIVNIGKSLTVRLKNGKEYRFRSTGADLLAEAINHVVQGGGPLKDEPGEEEEG